MYSRVAPLQIVLNAANNRLINRSIQNREELFNFCLADAKQISGAVVSLVESSLAAQTDPHLTAAGKTARIEKLQQKAREQIKAASQVAAFTEAINGHHKAISGLVAADRKKNCPAV